MEKKNKNMSDKEIDEKVRELKMGLLKQDAKRKGLRKAIARLLTLKNQKNKEDKK